LATKPTVMAGEEPVLTLGVRVTAALDVETVELNRMRTSIRIEPLTGGWEVLVLTGLDHIRAHNHSPTAKVGVHFHAPAGSAWTAPLHLLDYGTALAAGRYRVSLTYKYGESAEEATASNAVEIAVVAAGHLSNSYRWLAGATPQEALANLWRAEARGEVGWVYQVADRENPGAVRRAVAVAVPEGASAYRPVLAHIDDMAAKHYERFAVWAEAEHLGCVRVQQEGATRELRRFLHGLAGARIVEPPLQGVDGSLEVGLAGTASSVLLRIGVDGALTRTEIPFAGAGPEAETAIPADGRLVHPHVVATPAGGSWLVGFDPERGFVAERLAAPERQVTALR
jgi:hypothetical protein